MAERGPKAKILCPACGKESYRPLAAIRRAEKIGVRIFCNRACAGLGRRKEAPISPRNPNWKAMKKAYDAAYRVRNHAALVAKKAAYYAKTGPLNRDKEREVRKKRMPQHIEYCRQPEYRAYKKDYDLDRRAKKFGEFAESYKLLLNIQKEVLSRARRVEIDQQNGKLNKSARRKRDYEKITNQSRPQRRRPKGSSLGYAQPDQDRQDAASAG